jgi:5'-nucleotidase
VSRRILVTNDDGIHAEGLNALFDLASSLGTATIIAPATPLSGCSHQTTTDRELHLEQLAPDRYQVLGTPADCTRLGLVTLWEDVAWVLSGINDGGNLGVDTFMSGTVAAVREAALLGTPAIAFSQYRRDKRARNWEVSRRMAQRVWQWLQDRDLPRAAFWNVNFPEVDDPERPEIVLCPLEPHPLAVRFQQGERGYLYAGSYQQRARHQGTDVDVCFSGHIAVSLVELGESFARHA